MRLVSLLLRRVQPQSELLGQMGLDGRSLVLGQGLVIDEHFAQSPSMEPHQLEGLAHVHADVRAMPDVRHFVSTFRNLPTTRQAATPLKKIRVVDRIGPGPLDERQEDGLAVEMLECAAPE